MLSLVAAISGIYDLLLGGLLLLGRDTLARLTGSPLPLPPIHVDLNGLFLLVIGVGYVLPWRDPVRYRAYLWIMGPLLKGAGAAVFVADYVFRGPPAALLAFAVADGTLALVTLAALVRVRPSSGHADAPSGKSERPPA